MIKKMRSSGRLRVNNSVEGERIETKIRRIMTEKEPIKDGAPIVYTERKDGVKPEHNIRTDRFEIAVEAMDKSTKSIQARRENKADMKVVKDDKEADSGADSKGGEEQKSS
jgi:hypothetical protein